MSKTTTGAAARPWVRTVVTTAGDHEREAKSRLYNALEALGIMTFILIVMWPFGYLFGVLGGNKAVETLAVIPLVLGALYLLFVSPFLHRDTLESWGLGNPRTLWRMLCEGPVERRLMVGSIVAAIFIGINIINYWQWHEVADFFKFEGTFLERSKESFPGLLFVFAFGGGIAALIISYGIRYDNFLSAFKTAMIVALPIFAIICTAAFLQRGPAAFTRFTLGTFLLDVLGYLFWGFVQQLLFSSYFSTRVRKAFGPSMSPGNVVPAEKRAQTALLFGAAAAFIGAPFLFILLRAVYPPEDVAPGTVLWFALFIFPVAALYGYIYCLDKKRLLVATLAASFFGLIHIDSYGLVIGTWLLGIALVYVFMEDKNRNLVALGFIHGLNGSTLGKLFSKGQSGALEIDYSVGPWNVDAPTAAVLIIPLLCIAGYIALMAWSIRHIKET